MDTAHDVRVVTPERIQNLPCPPTRLLGRRAEIARAEELLGRGDVRLLTFTGPAGVGKTRLALEVASRVSDAFADGIFFVDLAPLSDHRLVLDRIAQTLGIVDGGNLVILERLQRALWNQHIFASLRLSTDLPGPSVLRNVRTCCTPFPRCQPDRGSLR